MTLAPSLARFGELAIHPDISRAIDDLGFMAPTPVQDQAIPILQAGRDLFAQAQTGTGKTGAFALPILERIAGRAGAPLALVIVPTRELCAQVAAEFQALGRHRSARIVALYGGVGYRDQELALRRGADERPTLQDCRDQLERLQPFAAGFRFIGHLLQVP